MGIGEAIAKAFAEEGANLVLAARKGERLNELAAGLAGFGGKVVAVPTDVTEPRQVDRLVTASLALTGRVDVLVNNAGVGINGAVENLDLEQWRHCLEVNLLGAVQVIQSFLPHLRAAGSGTIVQISSVLGKVSTPYTAGYNASKHALNAVSDALRLEVAPFGIKVVSVYPGSTESQFRTNSLGEAHMPKVRFNRVPAELVARRILRAVQREERDVYITFRDRLLCWAATRLPRLADWAIAKAYKIHA